MQAKYYVTLTDYGATQVAQAHDVASITLTQMVIGDANGVPYDPVDQKNRTTLVNQRASVPVQSVVINGAVTTVTATIPANIGGFNLHEIGLKDSTGQLVYIGNYHGGYKPAIAEGAGGELTIVIDIKAEAGNQALIEIDPNIVTANKDWVKSKIEELKLDLLNEINLAKQDVAVGDLYITTLAFPDAQAVANHKGYGTWEPFGNGHALVTRSLSHDNLGAYEWLKFIGATGGSNTHQLTVNELPSHQFNYPNQWAGTNPPNAVEVYSYDDIGWAKDGSADTSLTQHTNSVGGDQPHNIVQSSIVIAAWRRMT
ncbi:phage tail protein [Acinetobacter sp. Tr-809]|uniref:phage tail protein n=1 Tax=Acinetobacter sp. Tr-809 TaxID=2608324 RepID=UPI001D1935CC|nr:phage tail protein [Acinetobacter sp. Tr-809]